MPVAGDGEEDEESCFQGRKGDTASMVVITVTRPPWESNINTRPP